MGKAERKGERGKEIEKNEEGKRITIKERKD